ncbi:MAG: alginate lyase family protein [Promethearchaeota archaeon]
MNFVNYFKHKFSNKILLLPYFRKKKIFLSNSYKSDALIKKFIKKTPDYDNIRLAFYENNIFPYSKDSEREDIIEFLKKNFQKEHKKYFKLAEDILRKNFIIFEKTKKFNSKINWHYGFFNNFVWPLKESHKIEIRPNNIDVDVKYVWELNRHSYFIYLAYAYYLSGEEKYAIEFKNQILDWIKYNPPNFGINWNSALEISIRLINWIYSLYFLKKSKVINNKQFFSKIFRVMFNHAYYLRYFYSRRAFNHTVGELFGLYLFSRIFNKLKPIQKWEQWAFKKFKLQIILQTREDGTNIEQSINYHRFVLEFFLLFLILNPDLNVNEKKKINKMYDYILGSIKPNNSYPLIGDSDDATILPLNYNNSNLFDSLINLGAIIFKREDLKYISRRLSPTTILLSGLKGKDVFNFLEIKEPNEKICLFKKAGFFIIRNNWSEKANYLFIDYGRYGPQYAAHTHSSFTNFVFSYKGMDIIVDSGTYTYNKNLKERDYFRSSRAHNIVVINQQNQALKLPWFGWKNKPKVLRELNFNKDVLKFSGFHDGYKGFLVKRTIMTNEAVNFVRITDIIYNKSNDSKTKLQEINLYFHFQKDLNVKIEKNSVIIENILVIKINSQKENNLFLKNCYISPKYGYKFKNNMLNVRIINPFQNANKIKITTEINPMN